MPQFNSLLAAVLAMAGLVAARSPTAAVFPLSARGVDSNSTRILEDALADGLAKTGRIRLMERSQMASVLKEQGFQRSGACDGEQCAVQMGKLLGIEQGVIGSIGLLGRTWVLNARIVDIGTGEVLRTTQRSLSGEIDKVLTGLVPQVVSDLTGTASEKAPASPDAPKEEAKTSGTWVWWTLGGVAVAGGAATALILAGKGSSSTTGSGDGQTGSVSFIWSK